MLTCWSVGPGRPSDQRDAIVAGCLYMYLAGYLAIFLSRRRFRPRFHSGHLAPSEVSRSKRQTTLRLTTLNIHSDPMVTWERANQVRASPQLLGKRNACALHFRELKKNSHRSRYICSLMKVWHKCDAEKFEVGIILPNSQDPRILEIYKKVKVVEGPATGRFIRSCVSLLSEADRY